MTSKLGSLQLCKVSSPFSWFTDIVTRIAPKMLLTVSHHVLSSFILLNTQNFTIPTNTEMKQKKKKDKQAWMTFHIFHFQTMKFCLSLTFLISFILLLEEEGMSLLEWWSPLTHLSCEISLFWAATSTLVCTFWTNVFAD